MKGKRKAATIGEQLVDFVLKNYHYSETKMKPRFAQWEKYYNSYRGTRTKKKEWWQANYAITSLKEAIRTKVPLYMNILFAAGYKSFDIKPREDTDEEATPIVKDVIQFQLENMARENGGLFGQTEAFIKQFEMYGYSQSKHAWVEKEENGKLVFEGADMEVMDIFNTYPDPDVLNISTSWIITKKRNVAISYLLQQEAKEDYHSIKELKDTKQPSDKGTDKLSDDRVELLEYHGEVPKKLLEGKMSDAALADPYKDEYVKAIITIANRKVCIRNDKYPYDSGTIFCDASKDKMPNEQYGVGTGEDIQSYTSELTNAHNKFADCVNIVANPMAVINSQKMAGLSGNVILTHPGRVFITNPGVDDVTHAMMFVNTTAQAASLTPMITYIKMLEEKIEKTSQAVPVISAMPSKEGLPETLGATRMMQGNAAQPLKHIVRHCLEPWFCRMLEIIYKHVNQFYSKETAYRVLGKEKAAKWFEDKEKKDIEAKDIKLQGNIDFIPCGVSIFEEQEEMIANLLKFLDIAPKILKPQFLPNGEVQTNEEGQPVMVPVFDMEEIGKRIGENMKFPDLEELIPSLREKRERKEFQEKAKKVSAEIPSSAASSKGLGKETAPPLRPNLTRIK